MKAIIRYMKHILSAVLLIYSINANAFNNQEDERIQLIEKKLIELSTEVPSLNSKVNLSVSEASIQELIRGIAYANNVNVNIDPNLNIRVINNFAEVEVIDVLVFLCKEHDLDISITGSIISLSKNMGNQNNNSSLNQELNITYDREKKLMSLDLHNKQLMSVAKKITDLTQQNIILAPGLNDVQISGYILEMPLDNVLDKLAYANNLKIDKTKDGFYLIEKIDLKTATSQTSRSRQTQTQRSGTGRTSDKMVFDYRIVDDSVLILAEDAPLSQVINTISSDLGKSYFLATELEGTVSFRAEKISYDDLLKNVLNGSEYSLKKENGIYLIGENKMHELKTYKVLTMQYRSVEKILEFVPEELLKDIEIKEFTELNALLINGPETRVANLENFFNEIDQVVPVILIEVIITDISKTKTMSAGITTGIGESEITTGGQITPSVSFDLNANSMNKLIESFNGFGWVNLGKVQPNFYMSLRALEEDGLLKVRSTPKLSTLNGHEASLKIGNTEYYLEEKSELIGTQNPQVSTTKTYQAVNADLAITVKPIVSGNDQITMEIEVNQSDFTERISQFAPPGQVTRNFKSSIRIKDQEMILLGGLEDKKNSSSGSGMPFLSRIPIIKWIFSSRTKKDESSKLNIFIKPTIIR